MCHAAVAAARGAPVGGGAALTRADGRATDRAVSRHVQLALELEDDATPSLAS